MLKPAALEQSRRGDARSCAPRGALSGRDIEAVNKTVSGLTKLLFPDPELPVSDQDLEWIVRIALERLRVDYVDLIQLHSLGHPEDWEQSMGPGGAEGPVEHAYPE